MSIHVSNEEASFEMGYAIVFALSVLLVVLGFKTEVMASNIRHVENGREPQASAALLPNVVVVPVLFLALVYLLNLIFANLGYWAFAAFFVLFLPICWFHIRKMEQTLQGLIARKKAGRHSHNTQEH